jgi:hypothetical protein
MAMWVLSQRLTADSYVFRVRLRTATDDGKPLTGTAARWFAPRLHSTGNMHRECAEASGKSSRDKNVFAKTTERKSVRGFETKVAKDSFIGSTCMALATLLATTLRFN